MKKSSLVFPLLVLLGTACSDFFNSPQGADPAENTPRQKVEGTNPFPAGYDPNAGEFSEKAMLANIGLNVIAPWTKNFHLQAEILEKDIRQLCQALKEGEALDEEEAVHVSWRKAMLSFHTLDSVPVGPLSDHGRILRDSIYSWPRQNLCGIDLEVARLAAGGEPKEKLLYTMKGLGALEYLFFESEHTTRCNPRNPNNRPALDWPAKPLRERRMDRCRFAGQIAEDLVVQARKLEHHWDPQGPNFSKTLVDGSRYPSLRLAVNALSDALFSFEDVKDLRIGRPLGIHRDCLSPSKKCPENVEHPLSGLSLKAVSARLKGLKTVFLGSSSEGDRKFGFDDNLKILGHGDITDRLIKSMDEAFHVIKTVESQGPFLEQVKALDPNECRATTAENPLVPACHLHQSLRRISNVLKTEVLAALSLSAPPTHGGDND